MTDCQPPAPQHIREALVEGCRELHAAARAVRLAFVSHQDRALDEAHRLTETARAVLRDTRDSISRQGPAAWGLSAAEDVACLLRTAVALAAMANPLASVAASVRRKIRDRLLFSDLAVQEMTELLVRTQRQIRDLADALATGNPTLREHVLRWCANVADMISQFTSRHEERLVSGICSQPASAVFVAMADGLRGICHHVKNAAALCPPETDEP